MKKFVFLLLLSSLTLFQGCGAQWFPDEATGPTPQPAPPGGPIADAQADTEQVFPTYTVGTLTGATSTTISIAGSNDLGSGTTSTSSYTIKRPSASAAEGPFFSSDQPQTVSTGDVITVKHTSANGARSTASSFLSVGGARATYLSTTSQLAFPTRTGQPTSSTITSAAATVPASFNNGMLPTFLIDSISGGSVLNSGLSPLPTNQPLNPGDVIYLRHTSAATGATITTTTVVLKGTNGTTYTITFKSKTI